MIGENALAKPDELTSTERLLELIRNEQPPDPEPIAVKTTGSRLRTFLADALPLARQGVSVGVDLGHEDLKLVKVNRVTDRKVELVDFSRVELNPDIPRDHPGFPQFLRSALLKFCGTAKVVELWGTIPSARVENRYLKIPKVPPKQIANSVFWTYQKHSAFDEKETVFDYEVLGDAEEGGAKKIGVMAYTAPRKEVEDLRDLFARAGFPLKGISIVPFAFQTLLRSGRIRSHGAAISSLYIGRDWSRIDIFMNDSLVLSRGIKAGIRTMIEALQREIEGSWFELSLAKSPTSDQNRIRAIKMRLKQELEAAQNLFFAPIHSAPAADKTLAVKDERIFQMILPALERLVRQMERTIRHFALNFDNARVEKIYVSSGIQPHPHILDYIGDELGLPIEVVNPFAPGAGFESRPTAPESLAVQSAYAPAMGMALSTNAITPNFLYTHKDKGAASSTRRINRAVFAAFIVALCGCAGFAFWQEQQIREKDIRKLDLQNQLAAFDVRVDRNLILKLVDQIRTQGRSLQGMSNNLLGVALLGEVANTVPANIRLLSVNARLSPARAAGGKAEPAKKVLVIDGVVFGERATLEADLAGFLMTLRNSPLFKQPVVSKKSVDLMDNRPVMRFTAQMDVG
jgi:Tfp pilus assembly PilM family ATPase